MQQTLRITGMHCTSCAGIIESRVKKIPGVANVRVNFAAEKAQVEFDETQTNADHLIEIVKKAGYNAEIASTLGIEASSVRLLVVDLSKRLGLDHQNKRVALGCAAVRLGLVKP